MVSLRLGFIIYNLSSDQFVSPWPSGFCLDLLWEFCRNLIWDWFTCSFFSQIDRLLFVDILGRGSPSALGVLLIKYWTSIPSYHPIIRDGLNIRLNINIEHTRILFSTANSCAPDNYFRDPFHSSHRELLFILLFYTWFYRNFFYYFFAISFLKTRGESIANSSDKK